MLWAYTDLLCDTTSATGEHYIIKHYIISEHIAHKLAQKHTHKNLYGRTAHSQWNTTTKFTFHIVGGTKILCILYYFVLHKVLLDIR